MIPDVDEASRFKRRRIAETLEDALVLLRFHQPDVFLQDGLAGAEAQFGLASDRAWHAVLGDPKVGMWSLIDLNSLLESTQGADEHALAEDLSAHIRFVAIGLACLDQRSYATRVKWLDGGASIPGTNAVPLWTNPHANAVTISTSTSGELLVDGAPLEIKRFQTFAGFTIPHGDPFLVPPPLDGYVIEDIDEVKSEAWQRFFVEARRWLSLAPEADVLVSAFGNNFLPLVPSASGAHLSVSFKHRPGIIYATWSDHFEEVVEAIVHESDHQCLYELINRDALLTSAEINTAAVLRSPWRPDPRPPSGVIFGLSAFVTVGAFWTALLSEGYPGIDLAGKRAVTALEQSLDAIDVVSSHAVLTESGTELLRFNKARALDCMGILRQRTEFARWAAFSADQRSEHSNWWRETHRGMSVATPLTTPS